MRDIFHILHQPVLLLIMAAALLTSCSSDSPEAQENPAGEVPVERVINLVTYAPGYVEAATTRSAPEGYTSYLPVNQTKMGIYMLLDYESPTERTPLTYKYSRWYADFEVEKNKPYTVYGYLPKLEGMSSSLTCSESEKAATLTITGMKSIMTEDVCIVTGVNETETGLKEGSFSWFKAVTDDDYIYMLLNHLYASVRFSITVDTEYAQLRTIKMKSMKLSTDKADVSATISLTHNTTGEVPITNVDYALSDGSSEAVFFSDDEGEALSATTAKVFDTCFAPTLSNNLTLVSTYDVYDRKGNLIRKNCPATNKIPNLEASRGQRVQLNLTVNPSYLYVLSDPDLDNPTITIN